MLLAEVDESWLNRRYYGGDLPAEAERSLHLAAASFGNDIEALCHLARADELAPGHRLVDLGHYKFHFYKHNLPAALDYGERLVRHALAGLGVNHGDWSAVTPAHADFTALDHAPRFFLFALLAVGYLQLRLGRVGEARAALGAVCSLDPTDRFGAKRLLDLADRRADRGDAEDEG